MFIQVIPVPKPRMTRSDKWNQRNVVMRYRTYKDELAYKTHYKFKENIQKDGEMWIVFVMPLPESWPKKRKLEKNNGPHQQKPDIDNLVKGFLDAFLVEDEQVYEIHAKKLWGSHPGIYYGKEDYAGISETTKESEKGQNAISEPSEIARPSLRGVRTQGGLRMRGLLPGTRRR